LRSASSRAIVLEGDGNHLMGWSSAQFIGFLQLPVVHVVSCNGVYASTGGQAIPRGGGPPDAVAAAALGYSRGFTVDSADGLEHALKAAADTPQPCLVYIAENPASAVPPRCPETTARYADGFRHGAPQFGA